MILYDFCRGGGPEGEAERKTGMGRVGGGGGK